VTGVGTCEAGAGVTVWDERGLLFDRGREGACRKSSGMSFQLSMARGTEVAPDGTRGGAVFDFGGGGGRFTGGGATIVGFGVCSCCEVVAGFFSQLDMEDCIVCGILVFMDACRNGVILGIEERSAKLSNSN
jgi:hypothetical protein